jgi:CBS domain-containing protein
MLVRDIMSAHVKTVVPETPLTEVVALMCLYRYSGLPVVDDGNELIGIIAEKDVLHRLFPKLEDLMDGWASIDLDGMMGQYKDVVKLKVKDIMTRNPLTVPPDMHILKTATVMARRNYRRIPVAEGGKLLGMLSVGDVHKAIFFRTLAVNFGVHET